jgi:hypothetical protein
MDSGLLKAMLKQYFASSSRAFIIQFLEETAENFTPDELDRLVGIMQKVAKRKRGTVDAPAAR